MKWNIKQYKEQRVHGLSHPVFTAAYAQHDDAWWPRDCSSIDEKTIIQLPNLLYSVMQGSTGNGDIIHFPGYNRSRMLFRIMQLGQARWLITRLDCGATQDPILKGTFQPDEALKNAGDTLYIPLRIQSPYSVLSSIDRKINLSEKKNQKSKEKEKKNKQKKTFHDISWRFACSFFTHL